MGVASRALTISSAYSHQSVAMCSLPSGCSLSPNAYKNSGVISRRLWCRFFGQGSGKSTRIWLSEPGSIVGTSSAASPITSRTFRTFSCSSRRSSRPVPGRWGSIPIKQCSGLFLATALQLFVFPFFGMYPTVWESFHIAVIFMCISILRSWVWRSYFRRRREN